MIQYLNSPVQKAKRYLPARISTSPISGSIHQRIQRGYIASFAIVLAIMLGSVCLLQSSHGNFIESTHIDRELRWKNTEIFLSRNRATESIRAYFLSSDISHLNQYHKEIHHFNKSMSELLNSHENKQIRQLNLQLKHSSDALSTTTQKNIDLSKLGFPQSALFLWEQETQIDRENISHTFAQINETLNDNLSNLIWHERARQYNIFTIAAVLVVLGVVMSIFLGLLIARSLTRPIEIIRASATEISRGNFDVRLPVDGQDEVSQLAHSVNSMATQISWQLTTTQENAAQNERQRLARDMHDELAQTLFAAKLIVAKLNKSEEKSEYQHKQGLAQLSQQLHSAHLELRNLICQMNGESTHSESDPKDLANSFTSLLEKTSKQNNLDIETMIEVDLKLPHKTRMTFYRISQEALNNIVKHSNATRVSYLLKSCESTLKLKIIDNGKGIADSDSMGFGIKGMRQRAQEIGAFLDISSDPSGTRISVEWEYNDNA